MEIHPSEWTSLIAHLLHKDISQFMFYDHVIAAGITFMVVLLLALMLKAKMNLVPGNLQQVFEITVSGLIDLCETNIGHGGKKYLPLIGGLAFFIFISNFLGMVPSFSSATANLNTTVACAVIVFVYYNFEGLRANGMGYLKHFMGPMLFLAPLMIPVEIIGHLARPFSLSVRLFGNIAGEHIVTLVFYGMVPFLLPVPLMAIGLFASFLQAFVFIMLTMSYIGGAIAHDH